MTIQRRCPEADFVGTAKEVRAHYRSAHEWNQSGQPDLPLSEMKVAK